MQFIQAFKFICRTLGVTMLLALSSRAADPGTPLPGNAAVNDQKAGSVLVYNLISSSPAAPTQENTRISITNTNQFQYVAVHLFFVDGATCSVADGSLCLTPNQTTTLVASEIDPGTRGYLVAVAVDRTSGCPINFNYLIGDEYVTLATGHEASLTAEAIAALYGTTNSRLPGCDFNSPTAVLDFDGVSYNQVGQRLAWSNLPSPVNGNSSMLIVNRIGGDLSTNASVVGTLFGLLFDDAERPHSFSLTGPCQLALVLDDNSIRTVPPYSQVIPSMRSGWMWLSSPSGFGLLGAGLNLGGTQASGRFTGGHNLHKLSYASDRYVMPIVPPGC